MNIQHITELFALDGREFIIDAYRNLLRREPDEHGMAYYLGRLAQGYGKAAVVAQLAKSPECRPLDEIIGLKKLIADEHRAQHWFWGLFAQNRRLERAVQRSANALATQQSTGILDAVNRQAQVLGEIAKQIGTRPQPSASVQVNSPGQIQPNVPPLAAEIVRNVFVHILGREPESKETLNHHAQFESFASLREALINSEEFQLKLANLPEYARSIFLRQLRLQLTKLEG